jgi:hypothetical protein
LIDDEKVFESCAKLAKRSILYTKVSTLIGKIMRFLLSRMAVGLCDTFPTTASASQKKSSKTHNAKN